MDVNIFQLSFLDVDVRYLNLYLRFALASESIEIITG